LWSVILPRDPRTAFFVTITAALFGSLWVIIKGLRDQPWLTLTLVSEVLLLYLVVIISHHLLSPARASQRHGSRRGKSKPDG
jgi:hypothetical protein